MKGLSPIWAWRVGFTLLGAGSYFASAWLLARELVRIVGLGEARMAETRMRRMAETRMRRMLWILYFVGGATECLAGVWNPMGWKLVLISAAAASLGGASGLLWIPSIAAAAACKANEKATVAVAIPFMPMVCVTAAVLLIAYVWFLGPGVTLHFAGNR
jgi:hypothetical protein